jgi:hypothetical protein
MPLSANCKLSLRRSVRTSPRYYLDPLTSTLVTPSDTSATAFCIDCGEPEVPLRLIASCGHNMCAPCLSQRLKVALNLEIFCPVKCCETSLLKINIHKLGEQDDSLRNIADRLKPKVFDYMIDRYGRLEISCCGAFMKPADKPGWNECKKCWERTCKRCGELYHGTTLCIIDQPQDEAQYGMILQESEAITNDKTHVPEGEDGGKDNSW